MERAGIGKWEVQINDGIKLAQYVVLKEEGNDPSDSI